MTHLTDDQLFHLAELSCNAELLTPEEEHQLEHIKSCRECFNKYCVLATLMDATSLSCGLVFDQNALQVQKTVSTTARKLLASLRITYQHMQEKIGLLGEQLQQNLSTYAFESVLATTVRGGASSKTSVLRMEDIDDEGTYLIYDAENHKIMLRFAIKSTAPEKIMAYLKFEDQSTLDISLIQDGSYMKGSATDIPSGNFEVRIEEN